MTAQISVSDYEKIDPTASLDWNGQKIHYAVPNSATLWRVQTLFSKEVDTIAWIKTFQPGEVFVDIGANVGMYSIWAARTRGVRVFAFEPEAQNFALLNRNIVKNGLSEKVTAFCLAICHHNGFDRLYLGNTIPGESNHTFGAPLDFNLAERASAHVQGSIAATLDALIEGGIVPPPQHVKIDVDGLEHWIIEGARETLANPGLKSVLVELNQNLPEHRQVVEIMTEFGFRHDPEQSRLRLRKDGRFAGVGNMVFLRDPAAAASIAEAFKHELLRQEAAAPARLLHSATALAVEQHIARATVETDPLPYFYEQDVFPEDFYDRLRGNLPEDSLYVPITETGLVRGDASYEARGCFLFTEEMLAQLPEAQRRFWVAMAEWLTGDGFVATLLNRFTDPWLHQRFGKLDLTRVSREVKLLRDRQGYALGPHTDGPNRIASIMFYLPPDDAEPGLGTSFYRPKDPAFRCPGGPHHRFEDFELVWTVPYVPNAMVCFLKTDWSFHGVEPVEMAGTRRDSLSLTLRAV